MKVYVWIEEEIPNENTPQCLVLLGVGLQLDIFWKFGHQIGEHRTLLKMITLLSV